MDRDAIDPMLPAEEVLWTITFCGVQWRAELRPQQSSWAVLLFRESEPVYTQQFGLRESAVEWATHERERMQRSGGRK